MSLGTVADDETGLWIIATKIIEGKMRPTSNAFGWENLYLFQITEEFLTLIRNLPGIPKVADLGVALGYTTLCLLKETSAFVTANDLDAGHLAELYSQVPDGQKHRLSIIAGDALELNFQDSSLDGVLALRWMHFLRPAEIRCAFTNYAKWLKVGGLLCVTSATPFFKPAAAKFLAIYKERLRCNEEWPGEMDEETMCFPPPGVVTDHGYLFDTVVLEREAERAGFTVIELSYATFTDDKDGKEHVGLLAKKI